jgi:hypothetical protein
MFFFFLIFHFFAFRHLLNTCEDIILTAVSIVSAAKKSSRQHDNLLEQQATM